MRSLYLKSLITLTLVFAGYIPVSAFAGEKMVGESLVLAAEKPGTLWGEDIDPASVVVRSTYLPGGTVYEANRDYKFNAQTGTIARVAGSRIPDFSTNILYEKKNFNQGQFPGYGNGKFFVFVDYTFKKPLKEIPSRDAFKLLEKTAAKLKAGTPVKLIAFGDSIAAGGEASTVDLQFPLRYAEYLKTVYPTAKITFENGSTGGDTSANGVVRLEEKVLTRSPDLVLLAFGMNDHNLGGVPVETYKENLKQMVGRIREKTGADVIILSTFPSNPDWFFSTHQMEKYAAAAEQAAKDSGVAYADVFGVWDAVLKRKDPSSLLGNNINHPNDFGHWLYLQALEAVKF